MIIQYIICHVFALLHNFFKTPANVLSAFYITERLLDNLIFTSIPELVYTNIMLVLLEIRCFLFCGVGVERDNCVASLRIRLISDRGRDKLCWNAIVFSLGQK